MKRNYLLLLLIFGITSCSISKINQYVKDGKVQRREGRWVEENSSEEGIFISKGRYRDGEKIGIWRTSLNGNRYQREAFRKDLIKTKFYYPNGRIKEKGQSKMERDDDFRHWFYMGDWTHYNKSGQLMYIKTYHKDKKADSVAVRQ
ncbi:hypothetical protein FNJ88_12690 [Chryseobacterium sp. SNU WT5]|uniref:hypothetical protein n=1 Tax=Chryseobacterium sp. SNU WT5 TaxID=2594269 RepID=UPI0011810576|nr:hypothetical protein [Chryseobacterium sp. SNU WT5]QDP86366.1 hypothetical protein FNJ88_12690 [Chryseobacterium sp. SNU WT5]